MIQNKKTSKNLHPHMTRNILAHIVSLLLKHYLNVDDDNDRE